MSKYLLIALVVFGSKFAIAQKKDFTVVVSEDYSPFSFIASEGAEVQGITIDVMREVFKTFPEYQLRVLGYPWPRAQQMVKSGLADAMVTYPSQDRLVYADKSEHYAYQTFFKVFTYKDNPKFSELDKYKTIEQFADVTLCEYNASGWAKDNISGKIKNVSYASTFENKIKMLVAKRCNIIIENDVTVYYQARKMGVANQIVELSAPGWSTPFSFLMSKNSKNKNLLMAINKALKDSNKNKTVDAIMNRWAHEK